MSVGPNSICRKDDLPHPGVNDPSVAVYTLTQPESSSPALCGTVIVSTAPCHVYLFKFAKTKPPIFNRAADQRLFSAICILVVQSL